MEQLSMSNIYTPLLEYSILTKGYPWGLFISQQQNLTFLPNSVMIHPPSDRLVKLIPFKLFKSPNLYLFPPVCLLSDHPSYTLDVTYSKYHIQLCNTYHCIANHWTTYSVFIICGYMIYNKIKYVKFAQISMQFAFSECILPTYCTIML